MELRGSPTSPSNLPPLVATNAYVWVRKRWVKYTRLTWFPQYPSKDYQRGGKGGVLYPPVHGLLSISLDLRLMSGQALDEQIWGLIY
jgi:hypothetical protein